MSGPRIAILNPNATASMTEEMAAAAARALGPQARVSGRTNAAGPPAIQGPADVAACLPGLFALFDAAVAEGADAVVVGCFDDTGLGELRARGALPVVGLGEAGCIAGALAAARFAVVTTLAVSIPAIEENIRAMGLGPRCAGVHASGVAVLELGEGEGPFGRLRAAVEAAEAAAPGASVVLGCSGMTVLAARLAAETGVRIVDPVTAAARLSLASLGPMAA